MLNGQWAHDKRISGDSGEVRLDIPILIARLLEWYDHHRRRFPWRALPREAIDPYRVWISEIMLQQTTTVTVEPYFKAFMARWPRVHDLARADIDAVLHAWQGLGYYARARHLHACARVLSEERNGIFPREEAALRQLPGIGAYTAAAIAAIAFDQPVVPVDGNVIRVLARLHALDTPLPAVRAEIETLAQNLAPALAPAKRAGDFAQALMDLGATVCTPRQPRCLGCPWRDPCRARAQGTPETYPRRAAKAERPTRHGVVFWIARADGAVLLRRRPAKGLLGGLMELPSTDWHPTPWCEEDAIKAAPLPGPWRAPGVSVEHTFTHFHLTLSVLAATAVDPSTLDGVWCRPGDWDAHALPTLFRKVVAAVEGGETSAGSRPKRAPASKKRAVRSRTERGT